MNEATEPTHSSTLEEPIEITEVRTSDYLVERALAAQTLRAVAQDLLRTGDAPTTRTEIAHWLQQRAHVITQDDC